MYKLRDLTIPEIDKCIELCNFTDEEFQLFNLKVKDKAKRGNLSMADVQYADTLAHMKKNLLASEGMLNSKSHSSYAMRGRDGDGDGRYSEDNFRYSPDRGRSYAYSKNSSRDSLVDKLEYMAQSAVDEHERRILMDCANKLK